MGERFVYTNEISAKRDNGLSQEALLEKVKEQPEITHSRSHHPILTRTQEQLLFRDLRTGNDKTNVFMQNPKFPQFIEEIAEEDGEKWAYVLAKNETITGVIAACNHRLVIREVKKYTRKTMPTEDIIAGGTYGLLRAIEKFDPDKGTKFSTYAVWQISSGIQKALIKFNNIPQALYLGIIRSHRIHDAFTNIYQRNPTREELRKQLIVHTDFTREKIERILDIRSENSTHEQHSHKYKHKAPKFLPDHSVDVQETVLTRVEQQERSLAIGGAIERQLNAQERSVLEAVFGLGGNNKQSVDELASQTNRKADEVLFLLNEALMKLREDQHMQNLGKESGIVPRNNTVDNEKQPGELPKKGIIFEASPKKQIPQFEPDTPLDEKIKRLRLHNYNTPQMVDILGVSPNIVRRILGILLKNGETEPLNELINKAREQERNTARSEVTDAVGTYLEEHPPLFLGRIRKNIKNTATAAFDEKIKQLTENTELTTRQIAEKLGIDYLRVKKSHDRLLALGEITQVPPMGNLTKRKTKTQLETIAFDQKVKELRDTTDLSYEQMAQKLGTTKSRVSKSSERLLARKFVERMPTSRRKPETIALDKRVKQLREDTNLTYREIAELLGVSPKKIQKSMERLNASKKII